MDRRGPPGPPTHDGLPPHGRPPREPGDQPGPGPRWGQVPPEMRERMERIKDRMEKARGTFTEMEDRIAKLEAKVASLKAGR